MSEIYLIMGAVTGLLLVLGIAVTIFTLKKKKQGKLKETNYMAFFVMGIAFLPMGIILSATIGPGFVGFVGLGVVYMAIGLAHRDKWKK